MRLRVGICGRLKGREAGVSDGDGLVICRHRQKINLRGEDLSFWWTNVVEVPFHFLEPF